MAEQPKKQVLIDDDLGQLKERQKQVAEKLAAAALPAEEIDLRELQIKLEKIRAYVKRTEARIHSQKQSLDRLREKRMDMENKRLSMSVVKIGKQHDQNI
jgi:hypothetical protein